MTDKKQLIKNVAELVSPILLRAVKAVNSDIKTTVGEYELTFRRVGKHSA